MDNSKIVLGTVQLGLNYGISNTAGITTSEEAVKIFSVAKENNINFIDTAINYGDSENIIGTTSGFNIITKIPMIPKKINENEIEIWINNEISQSLKRLKTNKLYGVLLHFPEQLFDRNGRKIFEVLIKLKKNNQSEKIGISAYSTKVVKAIVNRYEIDIVQLPFNIINQELLRSSVLSTIKNRNIELHVRSIFLQGLLLISKENFPQKFSKWSYIFDNWYKWLIDEKISALNACLSFVDSFNDINKVIIGINNSKQLVQILKSDTKKNLKFPKIHCSDKKLINPSFW